MNLENLLAIVVLYNPSNMEIENVIKHSKIFKQLLIVDNSKQTSKHKFLSFKSIQYLHYSDNIGLSKAYNIGVDYCLHNGFEFMFIMDQDSEFGDEVFLDLKGAIVRNDLDLSLYSVLALTPHSCPRMAEKLSPELSFDQMAISSGSIINIGISSKIGGFDERFFIDAIDIEYCFRSLENNYKIVHFRNITFKHEVGLPISFKHLGQNMSSSNHSPLRYYYLMRNNLLLELLYENSKNESIKHAAKTSKIDTFRKLVFVRYENERILKYYYAMLGVYHFSHDRFGKIPDKNIVVSDLDIISMLVNDHDLSAWFLRNLPKLESMVNKEFIDYNTMVLDLSNELESIYRSRGWNVLLALRRVKEFFKK